MNRKIVITGATGLIGKRLARELIDEGNRVTVVSRSVEKAKKLIPHAVNYVGWNYENEPADFVEGQDIIVHLMGENIMSKRWTDKHKQVVYNSRIKSTRKIVEGIKRASHKPALFLHSSAIGFYGIGNFEVDDYSPKGTGFLSDLVDDWENEAKKVEEACIRKVSVRLGIVLDKNEGALKRMILPYKLFIGGPLGSGKQWFPWISIEDAAGIFKFAMDNQNISGAFNAVSPGVINMKEFSKSLGDVLQRPSLFRVPAYILKLVLGEAADALIFGVRASSKKLMENGYKFEYSSIKPALKSILK
ncbi:MAG: TIGR01777 family oxidoreductase [Bacteroidota bacterium]